MNIAKAGTGNVGLSNAILLTHHNEVAAIEITILVRPERGNPCPNLSSSIMKSIKAKDVEVIVYEPVLRDPTFFNFRVVNDLAQFKREADVIVVNHITVDQSDVAGKIYSRNLLGQG
jgi:UDP-glucose 6-dehydrogenase